MWKRFIPVMAVIIGIGAMSTPAEAGLWKKFKRGFWNQLKSGVGVKIDGNGVRPAGGVKIGK